MLCVLLLLLLVWQVMTKIGAVCLITIGIWVVIELAVQFGGYKHSCRLGAGERNCCQAYVV